jgi:hypothetical protein
MSRRCIWPNSRTLDVARKVGGILKAGASVSNNRQTRRLLLAESLTRSNKCCKTEDAKSQDEYQDQFDIITIPSKDQMPYKTLVLLGEGGFTIVEPFRHGIPNQRD